MVTRLINFRIFYIILENDLKEIFFNLKIEIKGEIFFYEKISMNLFDFLKSLNQLKIKTPEDPINVSFLLQISQREASRL